MKTRTLRIAGSPAAPDTGRRSVSRIPVVLVHGYCGRKSQWFAVQRGLREAGFSSVHTMSYNALTSDIPQLAERLVVFVRSVLAETGATRVHVVGHSLGGVIIRYAICVLRLDPLIDTAITVAAPHGGSPFARFGCGATAAQLRPGSAVLRELESAARLGTARWIAFHSNLDAIVPASRAMIRPAALRATNVLVKNASHLSILMSPRLVQALVYQLVAAEPRPAAMAA